MMVSSLALRLWSDFMVSQAVCCPCDRLDMPTQWNKQAPRWKKKNLMLFMIKMPCIYVERTFYVIPVHLWGLLWDLQSCTSFTAQENKDIFKNICGSGGAKCWHPLARWMVLALTERSFPAHLHSSLLVGEAGQGICNTNTVPVHVRDVREE